jgi:pyridine nucleotide-disulfide oxidoreductase family protein
MKHLVMIGASHAHVHMLSTLAAAPLIGMQMTLIAPYPRHFSSGMVPGFVAGHYALQDCVIPLEPLLRNTGISWLQRHATALNAQQKFVILDDGSTLPFDVLSINTDPVQDRSHIEQMMPGAREYALFVHPIETFAALWPKVVELGQQKPLRVAVICSGAAGFELACAVAHRLPNAAVTLLSGDAQMEANYPAHIQAMMNRALRTRGITVINERAVGLAADEVTLAGGARLACDVPLVAIGAQAYAWLQSSGLTLDAQGFVVVDAFHRSTSHPQVFAAGDVSTRADQKLPRSGVYAVRAEPPLSKNLRAVLTGIEPSPCIPQDKTLNLLSCGNRSAIASWGSRSVQGRWVWWLKNWIDRRFIKKYSTD